MKEPLLEMCFRHERLVWHFFLDDHNRLCCKNSPKEKKQWSEPVILQDSYGGQFVIALRSGEQIHMAASDEENVIWYHSYLEGTWSRSVVAEIHPLIEINDLSLSVDSLSRIHLLYCLRTGRKNGEWQINHSLWADTIWHSSVLDSGIGTSEAKSSALVDAYDNLHVIYSAPNFSSSMLIHQTFDTATKVWKRQEEIPLVHQENQQPCCVFDKGGNLHLVWICSDGRNFRAVYNCRKNRPWPEGGWDDPGYISDKGINAYSPYLLITGDSVTALWQQLNGVFFRVSEDLGQTWGQVEKQNALPDLNDYALNFLSPSHRGIGCLEAFSSSGPQVTLAAAASLRTPPESETSIKSASPVPVREVAAIVDISDKQISSTVKKFLLEYSDTRLTNRLMNQTIDNQEQHLELLQKEKQHLLARLEEQSRELKSFRALSELHRKESEALNQTINRLNQTVSDLENKTASLIKEKSDLEAYVADLEDTKTKLEQSLEQKISENSSLQHELIILKDAKTDLEAEIQAITERKTEIQEKLHQLNKTNTLLEAQIYNLQLHAAKLESTVTNNLHRDSDSHYDTDDQKELPYTMLTWKDYE